MIGFSRLPSEDLPKIYKQNNFVGFDAWTVQEIQNAQRDQEEGLFFNPGLLAQWMLRDGRLASVMDTRIMGILGNELNVSVEAEGEMSELISSSLEERWFDILPEGVQHEIMTWSILCGYAVAQIEWIDTGGLGVIRWMPKIKVWHPSWIRYDEWRRVWLAQTMTGEKVITPGDGRWALFLPYGDFGYRRAKLLSLAIPVLVRSFSWIDWSDFNDTLAHAVKLAIVPSGADKDTDNTSTGTPAKTTYLNNVKNLGRTTDTLIVEKNTDNSGFGYDIVEASGQGRESFAEAQEKASLEIAIGILGQNLTTEISRGGSFAAEKGHESVRQDIKEFDNEFFSTAVRAQITKPLVEFNFGEQHKVPWIKYNVSPPDNLSQEAKTMADLSIAVEGINRILPADKKVDVDALLTKFGVPTIEVDDAE